MKKPDYALNAVFAKVRCLYGKRLTDKNYSELINLRSVNEVAEYLKTKTAYSEIFEGLHTANELQRTQLENILNNKMYNDLESVIRFQKAAGNNLYEYFVIKFDTVQIMSVLGSIETKSNDYLFTFPVFYNERSNLDLYRLAQVKSYDELLTATEKTIYFDTLQDALTTYRMTGNLTRVQSAFRNFTDGEFIKLAAGKKKTAISEKDELVNLYKTMKDIHLIKVLYRIMRFDISDEATAAIAVPLLTNFTKKQLDDMVHAHSVHDLSEVISKTYLSGILSGKKDDDIFHLADEYLVKTLANTVRRSNDPGAVMFAYFHLSEFEIKNIIHIIEGIRYGLSPSEIMPMLSGVSPLQ